jgi:hypothetical protein
VIAKQSRRYLAAPLMLKPQAVTASIVQAPSAGAVLGALQLGTEGIVSEGRVSKSRMNDQIIRKVKRGESLGGAGELHFSLTCSCQDELPFSCLLSPVSPICPFPHRPASREPLRCSVAMGVIGVTIVGLPPPV